MFGISEKQLSEYFAKSGLTISQAEANLKRRFPSYTDEKIQEELRVGVLCEQLLGQYKKLAQMHPEVFALESKDE